MKDESAHKAVGEVVGFGLIEPDGLFVACRVGRLCGCWAWGEIFYGVTNRDLA